MPIAFDPPTHAPHGTLPTRAARGADDDPAALDIFTQLLLAAANVQDAPALADPTARAPKDDPGAGDATVLSLPLPAALAGAAATGQGVTIVASEKAVDVRAAQAIGAPRPVIDRIARPALAGAAAAGVAVPVATGATGGRVETATILEAAAKDALSGVRSSRDEAPHAVPADDDAPHDIPAAAGRREPPPTPAAALAAMLAAPMQVTAERPVASKTGVDTAMANVQAAVAQPAPITTQPVHVETVSAPAFTPGWQDETVNKLASIVLNRNERAELKLNPAELGPVNVRVEMRADQVSVQIVAASAETRSALEQSLPQLRDLLASQGITLGQATVHDNAAQRDARPDAWKPAQTEGSTDEGAGTGRGGSVQLVVRRSDRLVDIFA